MTGNVRPRGNIDWRLLDGPARAVAVLWLGNSKFANGVKLWDIKQVGCRLYTNAAILFPFATDANGFGSVKSPIPCDASLVASTLFSQCMTIDFATQAPVPLPLTNGYEILVGGTKK